MSRIAFTEARIRALKTRKAAYDLRDSKLTGFGVRVLPSGRKRFFIHCQHRGERLWKIVGDPATMDVREARSQATAMLAAIRRGEDVPGETGGDYFEAVAETVFRRHERVWKSRTLYVNRCYLRNQLLPHFAGRRVADIGMDDVRNWFASLRATPVAADRSMPVLSVIMREAEAMGLRPEGSNPCRGIRRYRRKGRERFLSDEEIRRLSATLSAHADRRPGQVAVIRLLLLTGCRPRRDPDTALVGLSRRPSVPPGQQDGPQNRLAVGPGQAHSRYPGANRSMGLSGRAAGPPAERGVAAPVLVPGPHGTRPVRRAPSRPAPHSCQHRPEAGRNRPRDRQAARTPQPRDDAQIYPSRRHDGPRGRRDGRRRA